MGRGAPAPGPSHVSVPRREEQTLAKSFCPRDLLTRALQCLDKPQPCRCCAQTPRCTDVFPGALPLRPHRAPGALQQPGVSCPWCSHRRARGGGTRGCLEGVWAPSAAPTLPPPKAGQAERALPADPGCLRARFHLCYHLPGDVGRSFAEPPWPLGPVFLNQAVAGTNSPLPGSPRPGVSGRGPGAAPGTGPILRPAPGPGQRSLPGAFPAPRLPRENNWCGWSPCSPPPRLYIIAYFN